MIPSIETIVEDLLSGVVSKNQAIAWLYAHSQGVANDLRDHFAAQALVGWNKTAPCVESAKSAYEMADAMMAARGL